MSLTPFQSEILRLLASNRSPESYVAGGMALHASDPVRFSSDLDVFHDAEESVIQNSDRDVAVLESAGYGVVRELWTPAYRRAWISRGTDGMKLEWAHDSAWRFFPIQPDPVLGWVLHRFDALTNKALALGSRSETRDVVDLVCDAHQFPLHALVWAACGKDPGYSPGLLLGQMRRNARIRPEELLEMGAAYDAPALKGQWLALVEECERSIAQATRLGIEVGVAFLHPDARPGWFDQSGTIIHRPVLGGAFPRIV